jgi:hypothetical protein
MRGMSCSRQTRTALAAFASLALVVWACACGRENKVPDAPASQTSADNSACPASDLERTLVSEPSAPVIVLLRTDTDGVPAQQAPLLEELGADFQLGRSYSGVPGFAGTITRRGYERARAHRDVRCIQLDHPGTGGG